MFKHLLKYYFLGIRALFGKIKKGELTDISSVGMSSGIVISHRVKFVTSFGCDRNNLKVPLCAVYCLLVCFCTQLVQVQPTCHSFAMQSTWHEQAWLWKTWAGWHFHWNSWSVCVSGALRCVMQPVIWLLVVLQALYNLSRALFWF